jgi:hypothetical protein
MIRTWNQNSTAIDNIFTYLGVCVTYRRVLDWWRICCTFIQLVTTFHKPLYDKIYHTLPPPKTPSILQTANSLLRTVLLITSRQEPHRKYCLLTIHLLLQGVFTSPCIETVVLFVRACTFPREPLYRRCLGMNYSAFQAPCQNIYGIPMNTTLFPAGGVCCLGWNVSATCVPSSGAGLVTTVLSSIWGKFSV